MKWLGNRLGYRRTEDWYGLTISKLNANGGGSLRHWSGGSVLAILRAYKSYSWLPWRLKSAPQGFWRDDDNVRTYLRWLETRLRIRKEDDWYKVTQATFEANFGGALLSSRFRGSVSQALRFYKPEVAWQGFRFANVPHHYWSQIESHREYAEWLGSRLGYHALEDWHDVRASDFAKHCGGGLLRQYYGNSPVAFLEAIYPDVQWLPWLFRRGPQRYWHDPQQIERYMQWLGSRLGFHDEDDWHSVTNRQFIENHGAAILANQFGNSPIRLLRTWRPNFPWEPDRFQSGYWKTQRNLYLLVRRLFPGKVIEWNYKHPSMRFSSSGYPMELDVFVPSEQLAIEYQGESHFIPIERFGGREVLREVRRRDQEKRDACVQNGIALVEVTFRCDRSETALRNAIQKVSATALLRR